MELQLRIVDSPPIRQWQMRKIAAFMNQKIEHEIADGRSGTARMLEQIELGPSFIVERDYFTIHDCVLRKLSESGGYSGELPVEGFLAAREQTRGAICLDGNRSIAVELDFVDPLRAFGQLRYGQALHRLDECRFCCWKRTDAVGHDVILETMKALGALVAACRFPAIPCCATLVQQSASKGIDLIALSLSRLIQSV